MSRKKIKRVEKPSGYDIIKKQKAQLRQEREDEIEDKKEYNKPKEAKEHNAQIQSRQKNSNAMGRR